jgi:Holliday junction resolvase
VSRGHDRERAVRRLLAEEGWWTCRAAGSFGDADIVALRAAYPPRLVEVKSTTAGAFHSFGPADRVDLQNAARTAGAEAWLVWWPPHSKPTWIHEADWPRRQEKAA